MGIGSVNYGGGNAFPWGPPEGKYAGTFRGLAGMINSYQDGLREREKRGQEQELWDRQRTEWGREDELWGQQQEMMNAGPQMDPASIKVMMDHIRQKMEYMMPGDPAYPQAVQELAQLEALYRQATGIPGNPAAPPTGGGGPAGTMGSAGTNVRAQLEGFIPTITDQQEQADLRQIIATGTDQAVAEAFRRITEDRNTPVPTMGAEFVGPQQQGRNFNLEALGAGAVRNMGIPMDGGQAYQPIRDFNQAANPWDFFPEPPMANQMTWDSTIWEPRENLGTPLQHILNQPPGAVGGWNMPPDPRFPAPITNPSNNINRYPALGQYLDRFRK